MTPQETELYEDKARLNKQAGGKENQYSPYCDFIYYRSTIHPELTLAMKILKPEKPSHILASTHGWHMSAPKFENLTESPKEEYLRVFVDMRGRAFSEGKPDCNGWELYDVIDAVEYVKEHYREYLLDDALVYFEGGSGGGGNCYELLVKFPDYFAAATALCGVTDFAVWYRGDAKGEFRDDMDIWIGKTPDEDPDAYIARSPLYAMENLYTPLYIAHGDDDGRIPVTHSRAYVQKAGEMGRGDLVRYYELSGVGDSSIHFKGATEGEMDELWARSEKNRQDHRSETVLPRRGTLKVHGYLKTKHFFVKLDRVDRWATVTYDIDRGECMVNADSDVGYSVEWLS